MTGLLSASVFLLVLGGGPRSATTFLAVLASISLGELVTWDYMSMRGSERAGGAPLRTGLVLAADQGAAPDLR